MSVHLDFVVLLGVLAPLIGALVILTADVIWPRQQRLHYVLAFISLVVAGLGVAPGLAAGLGDTRETLCLPVLKTGAGEVFRESGQCLYSVNAASSTLQLVAIVAAFLTLLLAWPSESESPAERTSVMVALVLAATGGAVGVAGAHDVASWIIALEIATVPVIVLVALPGTKAALSGAVQLLTTSLISVGLVALGAATWYIATGTPMLSGDAALGTASSGPNRALLTLSILLFIAGLGFKLSLAPFHAWTPTAYVGASLPIATFLSGVSKVAALAALIVIVRALSGLGAAGVVSVAVLSVLSMTLGNLVALRQNNVVRLLAWSTIAQAGWVVLPLTSPSNAATQAASIYLAAYVVATVLAFSVVTAVSARYGQVRSGAAAQIPGASVATVADLSGGLASGRMIGSYSGLLRRSAFLGGGLALALTSLAGIPPGLLGLVAKVGALRPVLSEGWWLLALAAGINVVLGAAVYFRWFRVLLAEDPDGLPAGPEAAHPAVAVAIAIGSALLLVLSLWPALLTGLLG